MANNLLALKEECRALYLAGSSYKQIRNEKGVSLSTLSYWCRDIVRKPPARKSQVAVAEPLNRRSTVDHGAILHMWENTSASRQDIADQMGVNISTVHGICKGHSKDPSLIVKKDRKRLIGLKGEGPYADWHLYFSKDRYGAKIVHMVHKDTRERLGMRYARYLMAVHLGRVLLKTEVVHYKHGIVDEIDNLEIKILRSETVSTDTSLTKPCGHCQTEFTAVRARAKYCSDKCRNDARYADNRKERVCRGCDTSFTSSNLAQRYCGEACRVKHGPPKHGHKKSSTKKKPIEKAECVVCLGMFLPTSPDRDVCYSQSCNDVIASAE